jgi:hypothetical protein
MAADLGEPFSDMLGSYLAAKENTPPEHKSSMWGFLPDDYERAISNTEAWTYFMRNSLSAGLGDDLAFFYEYGNLENPGANPNSPPELLKRFDFSVLLPETFNQPDHINLMKERFLNVSAICGQEFILSNLAPDTGSPAIAEFNIKANESAPAMVFKINYYDLGLIYYYWQISRVAKKWLGESPTIIEIGGGYGGVLAKMKDLFPDAKCIMFDLPEVNAGQTYYLSQRYPSANILGFKDFVQRGPAIFEEKADFFVLPGWLIQEIPENTADLVFNIQSMMEMTPEVIDFYFAQIQRVVPVGGLFACYNRYLKLSAFKNYPYDDRWRGIVSQTSALQSNMHELIVERTETPQAFPVAEVLKSLMPFY